MSINSTLYKNALTVTSVTIPAGQTVSPVIECIGTPIGAGTIIAVRTASTFTPCDLTFLSVEEGLPDVPLFLTDAATLTQAAIFTGVIASSKITIPPFLFFAETSIKLVCSTAQLTDTEIRIYSQPIVQGAA